MMADFPYDAHASVYAATRTAAPWVLEPLLAEIDRLPPRSRVLEVGCGTGNYIGALAARRPSFVFTGIDRSREMLRAAAGGRPVAAGGAARAREARAGVDGGAGPLAGALVRADAGSALPIAGGSIHLAIAVDVVHHVRPLDRFFREVARVLAPCGRFLIATDSEDDLERRSLSVCFPEILPIERSRYPSLESLHVHAGRAGFALLERCPASGRIPIDEALLANLEAKCSSSLTLIPDVAHRRGIDRVRAAAARGEAWLSSYTVLVYGKRGGGA